jgi:hypothetical protein
MSQLDIENNTNLFSLIKFIKYCESNLNPLPEDDYGKLITKSYQNYRKIFSRVKRRDYNIEPSLLDFLSIININDIPSTIIKILSIEKMTQLLNIFISLSSEQNNMISIVKFIYYYQINKLDRGGIFGKPISDFLRRYSHKNWQIYNELVRQLKVMPINELI